MMNDEIYGTDNNTIETVTSNKDKLPKQLKTQFNVKCWITLKKMLNQLHQIHYCYEPTAQMFHPSFN